jgi:hypothetical protein
VAQLPRADHQVIPLGLYVFSRLNLNLIGREAFSLGRLSRPCAWLAILWLVLGIVQGSMPGTVFNGSAEYLDGGEYRSRPP